jgi:hypothetical protein
MNLGTHLGGVATERSVGPSILPMKDDRTLEMCDGRVRSLSSVCENTGTTSEGRSEPCLIVPARCFSLALYVQTRRDGISTETPVDYYSAVQRADNGSKYSCSSGGNDKFVLQFYPLSNELLCQFHEKRLPPALLVSSTLGIEEFTEKYI